MIEQNVHELEGRAFDEMSGGDGKVRPAYALVAEWLDGLSRQGVRRKQQEAETLFRRLGITFSVYAAKMRLSG